MIDKIKKDLRVNGTVFDDEIEGLIASAKLDLGIGGVNKTDENDALIYRAISLYCKAHFGMANPDSEKYQEAYTELRTHLSLAGGYRSVLE